MSAPQQYSRVWDTPQLWFHPAEIQSHGIAFWRGTSTAVALPEGVPSHYVVCARDAVIPPEQQRAMAAELPGAAVHELDTGHSPFFAAPVRLAALLDEIARAV